MVCRTVIALGLLASGSLAQGQGRAPAAELSWQATTNGRQARLAVPTAGKTGFTLLAPAQTGIRFVNALDDRLIMENNNFMQGAGVALGDFDGDGWCDIYFCAIDGTNALYRNLGNWTFVDVTAAAGVGGAGWHSTGAVFADIDGDGDLDLLVNTLGRGTHLFLNLGGGRFREATAEAGLTSTTGSTGLALADIDGDGDLDLYVANYGALAILRAGGKADLKQVNGKWQVTGPYAERLRYVEGRLEEVGEPDVLYRNDGQGHFQPVPWNSEWFLDEEGKPMPPPWDFGLTVQMRDINEDGFPDIYVCNDFQTVDRLWLNDGTGHFRLIPKLALRKQSFAAMGVDFGDLDRDGHLDFLVVEMFSREHQRRLRQVGGMQPSFPAPGRFDHRPEVTRNTFFWNRGDGTYAEIANYAGLAASEWSWQPVFLDVDLDGFEDILVVNGNAFDVQDRDTLKHVRSLGQQTTAQAQTNILLYPRLQTPNVAFHNRGDLTFDETGRAWGFDSALISHGVALADLDHDGDLDVIVNCLYSPPLIYRNESAAPRVAVRLRGRPPNVQGIGGKIQLLGGAVPRQSQEIICGGRYLSGDDPERVFAAGSLTNRMRLEVTWRSGRQSIVENVQANSLYEIDEAAAGAATTPAPKAAPAPTLFEDASGLLNHHHHEELYNDYGRQPLLMKQLSQLGPGVAWFDLNGDGHEDLFIACGKGGQLAGFLGNDHGRFVPMALLDSAAAPDDLLGLVGWVTAGGRRQLLASLAHYENAALTPSVWAWEATPETGSLGHAQALDLPPSPSSPGPLAVADFDGDGNLDLFIGGRLIPGQYPQPASSQLCRQVDGQLVNDTTTQPGLEQIGLVSGAVWTDLNNDGWPELVLAGEWGPLKIFRNDHGKLAGWDPMVILPAGAAWRSVDEASAPSNSPLSRLTGWWNSIAAADIDGDGRLDLIAGNWGLNSPDQPAPTQPARLFYGDIGGRGALDLVEADYAPELRAAGPRRGLSALAQAAPRLAELFPTHHAFSTVTIPELIGRLQVTARDVQAATLASMCFLNRGDHFEALPLPAEAQWAPVFGITVADFDGDGHEDVFLSQNFFALRPEMPRLDGGRGLLLRGTETGRLEPMPGQQSGILIYGEQRGAAAGDFDEDGRVDLVVTQNGSDTWLLHNRGGRPGLRVRLQGPRGNPQGIGATLRSLTPDRPGPLHEIHAGSGYGSQDSAVVVLPLHEPVTRLQIRWPGGKLTEVAVPAASRDIAVDGQGKLTVIR